MKMKKKVRYAAPRVLSQVKYGLNSCLLGASIEVNTKVISMGQEVVIHDFASDASLETYWE